MDEVRVTVIGLLKKYLRDGATVASGQSVAQAVESLQLGISESILAVVNGRIVPWDYMLKPGDELLLVQSIAGGNLDSGPLRGP